MATGKDCFSCEKGLLPIEFLPQLPGIGGKLGIIAGLVPHIAEKGCSAEVPLPQLRYAV